MFEQNGLSVPERPVLISDSDGLRVWSGLAMRVKLARIIGIRRAGTTLRLLAAEAAMRAGRQSERGDQSRTGVGRRGLIAAAAGAIGAVVFGRALPAAAKDAGQPATTPLRAAARDRVLASSPVREAVAVWGPVDSQSAVLMTDESLRVAVLPHGNSGAVTYVTENMAETVGITLIVDAERKSLRYHSTTGQPLLAATVAADGSVRTENLATATGTVEPDSVALFATCLYYCVGAEMNQNCVNECAACVSGGWTAPFHCSLCSACAGVTGVRCAWDCRSAL